MPAFPACQSLSSPYNQNFNGLATSGTPTLTSDSTIPGWFFNTSIPPRPATYNVSAGTGTAGGFYSFGTGTETDRAFGSIGSNALGASAAGGAFYGVCLINDTGAAITTLYVKYTGEQWRNGGNATAHKLDFAYNVVSAQPTDGTFSSGTYTDVNSLDFTGPVASTSAGALNGNNAANQASFNTSFAVNIPAGQYILLRWFDLNDAGNDHGLAIDDLSVSTSPITDVTPVDITPTSLSPSAATVGTPYTSGTITATNGAGCTWSVSPANALSDVGLALSSTNQTTTTVTGTPTSAGAVSFSLSVSCTTGGTDSQAYTLTINPAVVPPSCGVTGRTFIGTLQGTGTTGSANGIEVEGIVVGDYQTTTQLGGFFLQDADHDNDGNPLTSDGVFVLANSSLLNVSEGQRVRVRGNYLEGTGTPTFGRARITPASAGDLLVCPTQTGAVTPVSLTLPLNDNAALTNEGFEAYEGMLVQIANPSLTVTGNFDLGRFGGFEVAPQRLITFTQNNAPSTSAYAAFLDDYFRRVLTIDDGSEAGSLYTSATTAAPYPTGGLSASNTLRAGSTVSGTLRGVLDFSFSKWRLQPVSTTSIAFNPDPRPAASDVRSGVGGRLRIGFGNVLNYFNGPSFPGTGARGAENSADFARQRTKIVNGILALDPFVYGVSELENDGFSPTSAVQDLVDGLNAIAGPGVYAFVNLGVTPVPADNAITNGILYRTDRVTPVGSPALRSPIVGGTRATIAQRFRPVGPKASIQEFTVAVVHFKSKGCGGASGSNLDQGDGQSCFNADRVATANDVRQWLLSASSPVGDPATPANRRIVIVGDYNAYGEEDPVKAFENNGYVNLLELFNGPSYYSYQFDEQFGALDHALATPAFARLVSGATEWHSNADEPKDLDFNTDFDGPDTTIAKPAGYLSTNEYRTSDHDPLLIGFNPLAGDFDNDGDVDTADQTALRAQLGRLTSTPNVDRRMDLDGDGRITLSDAALWLGLQRAYINAAN
jgi:uncharacterized protein